MPRKKKLVDRIGLHIWNAPIKSFAVFFAALNVTLFLCHRIIMFYDFFHQESALLRDDKFVNDNICLNNELRANLGASYIDVCHRAEVDSQKFVWLNAFRRTIQHTYLCGDVSCIELFETIVEIISRSLAWTIASIIFGIVLTICLGVYCFGFFGGGSRRWKKSNVRYVDLEEQEFDQPLQIIYDGFDDYKKKI